MQRPVGAHTRRPVQDPPGAHVDEGPGDVQPLLSACHVRDDRQVADAVVPVAAARRAKASLDRLATDGHRLVAEGSSAGTSGIDESDCPTPATRTRGPVGNDHRQDESSRGVQARPPHRNLAVAWGVSRRRRRLQPLEAGWRDPVGSPPVARPQAGPATASRLATGAPHLPAFPPSSTRPSDLDPKRLTALSPAPRP